MLLQGQKLSQYRWENRLIVLYASEGGETLLQEQMALLSADRSALEERKLVVYQFKENEYQVGLGDDNNCQSGSLPGRLRSKVPPNATYILFLIGLDGGVKMKRTEIVQPQEIYNLIDQMPMRRAELNGRNY